MLDARSERTLTEVTEQLRTICGERLLCVALCGSGVGPDFVPESSDLNLVVVLRQLDREVMQALRAQTKGWHARRVSTPLIVEEAFFQGAADVFPMELHDFKDRHRVLFGEDILGRIQIRDRHLRYQCEHEARGKLQRLRELYFEIGDKESDLQTLLLDSLKTFLTVVRAVVRLHTGETVTSYGEALTRFSEHFSVSFPAMSRLLQIKLGKERWSGSTEDTFHGYVGEVERLVRVIDEMTVAD